jgi:serine/threonine protein kinase
MAADLWSFGVLTVRVLTGLMIREDIDTITSAHIEIADFFVWVGDRHSRQEWLALPPRALHFIQGLLVIDPEQRMTALEALNHAWYKMPPTEAAELEEGHQRVIGSWKARETGIDVIENLPGRVVPTPAPTDRVGSKLRRGKIPDASLSPYFGLDRHLMQKVPSKRKDILANLNESGSHFITEPSQNKHTVATTVGQADRVVTITSVDGSDIFGKSLQPDLDNVKLVPATPIASPEKAYGSPVKSPADSAGENFAGVADTHHNKRARKESWDLEDRRIHDVVAKQLPTYTTGKAMKEMTMVGGSAKCVRSI